MNRESWLTRALLPPAPAPTPRSSFFFVPSSSSCLRPAPPLPSPPPSSLSSYLSSSLSPLLLPLLFPPPSPPPSVFLWCQSVRSINLRICSEVGDAFGTIIKWIESILICCPSGKRVNDDNAPMYEVVLEIGHYRYRPLTAERLGRSISLIPPPILEEERRRDTVGDTVTESVCALSGLCSCDVILCSSCVWFLFADWRLLTWGK